MPFTDARHAGSKRRTRRRTDLWLLGALAVVTLVLVVAALMR